jgi:small subunit ribosomal protein S9
MEILARAVGRRKEAVAQVQLVRGTGQFIINEQLAEIYLQNNIFSLMKVKSPFETAFDLDFSFSKGQEKHNSDLNTITGDIHEAQEKTNSLITQLDTIVKVKGGGLIGQADAIKLAVARALCHKNLVTEFTKIYDDKSMAESGQTFDGQTFEISKTEKGTIMDKTKELRKNFKLKGFLTQDSRIKERRKYGLKKARKAPQYSKR